MTAVALYEKYAQESFQNSFDHGFWEGGADRSKGEMVKLMIGETSGCQEADRKGKIMDAVHAEGKYTDWCFKCYQEHQNNPDYEFRFPIRDPAMMSDEDLFKSWFLANVKDTTGDELADVAICIMDFVHGWRCHFVPREPRKESTGNFSHDLLRIDWYILQAFHDDIPGHDWGYTFEAVCKFADWWGIDLNWHIAQKQRYNRTRPVRHGKKY